MRNRFLPAVVFCLLFAVSANAQISGNFSGQDAIILGRTGDAPATCDGTTEGMMIYDSSKKCLGYCDGDSWACIDGTALSPSGSETSAAFSDGAVVLGTSGPACSGTYEGGIRYNTSAKCVEYCDGDNWMCTNVVKTSCKTILESSPNAGDGVYKINPGGGAAFSAYCDMTTDGGGWTLAMRLDDDENNFNYDANYWTTSNTLNTGSPAPLTGVSGTEAKYDSFNTVAGDEMRIEWMDPDYDMIYDDFSDKTLLELFSGGAGSTNVNISPGSCNGTEISAVDGYTSTYMQHGQGAQMAGLNVRQEDLGSYGMRYGFSSNDENNTEVGERIGIGLDTNGSSARWSSHSDCDACGGCYGTHYTAADTAANLWIR